MNHQKKNGDGSCLTIHSVWRVVPPDPLLYPPPQNKILYETLKRRSCTRQRLSLVTGQYYHLSKSHLQINWWFLSRQLVEFSIQYFMHRCLVASNKVALCSYGQYCVFIMLLKPENAYNYSQLLVYGFCHAMTD